MMKPTLEHFTIVLHKPRFPENIGSAARAARNMGISNLILVDPENPHKERMLHLATRMGADIIKSIKIYDELTEAVADFGHVVGTTARTGGVRTSVKSPRSIASYLASLSENNRIALLFGPEDRGLTNHEIRLCHTLVTIPTSAFSSVNLSHAVMILCYELFTTGMPKGLPQIPKLADSKEMEWMYDRLKKILVEIDYIKDANSDYWMMKIRRSFARAHLTSRGAATILGICRQIEWRINNLGLWKKGLGN